DVRAIYAHEASDPAFNDAGHGNAVPLAAVHGNRADVEQQRDQRDDTDPHDVREDDLAPSVSHGPRPSSRLDIQAGSAANGAGRGQARASSRPSPTDRDSAYSMWRTRRGAASVDFDEAWMIKGRIAMTPPRSTRSGCSVRWLVRTAI